MRRYFFSVLLALCMVLMLACDDDEGGNSARSSTSAIKEAITEVKRGMFHYTFVAAAKKTGARVNLGVLPVTASRSFTLVDVLNDIKDIHISEGIDALTYVASTL